jgi:hypothetical protein
MPDILAGYLAEIPDAEALESLAVSFNARADRLSRDGTSEAKVWACVYSVLALSAESALLSRRTGIRV